MGNSIRVCLVLAGFIASIASATAPAKHAVQKAETIEASYDATWSAVIELFAERDWTISNLEKDSGLITTDWMSIANDTPYADCGGSGITSVNGTQIRLNVLVTELEREARVVVNTSFRQHRSFDKVQSIVDCTSKGGIERLIHDEVSGRAARQATRKAPSREPAAPRFHCTAAPADATLGACARSVAGCAKRQADLVASAGDATPCVEQATVVCFRATTSDGRITESCHPTDEVCAKQHDKLATDTAFADVTSCAAPE